MGALPGKEMELGRLTGFRLLYCLRGILASKESLHCFVNAGDNAIDALDECQDCDGRETMLAELFALQGLIQVHSRLDSDIAA
jgi:hypothetical protein